jgi:putative ABC transport system substrate-binding protein
MQGSNRAKAVARTRGNIHEILVVRNLLLLTFFSVFLMLGHGFAGAGQEIVAVQSARVAPYEEAIKGFKSVCDAKIKRLFVPELQGDEVLEKIHEIKPDMILAIGMDGLSKVRGIKDIPVVYLMVLDPQPIVAGKTNITGVSMNVPQEKQLVTLLKALPNVKTVGILYDPDRTGALAKKAREAAGKTGIDLITREVRRSKDVPLLIEDMRGKIDVFWMIPDVTVITRETIEFLLLFSFESNTPILTFAEKYVELGALMSIGIDAFDMGCQAGEMAKKILSGGNIMSIQGVDARKAVISVNLKVARKLGITIDKGIIGKAKIIN